jgi:hypothetical protein
MKERRSHARHYHSIGCACWRGVNYETVESKMTRSELDFILRKQFNDLKKAIRYHYERRHNGLEYRSCAHQWIEALRELQHNAGKARS